MDVRMMSKQEQTFSKRQKLNEGLDGLGGVFGLSKALTVSDHSIIWAILNLPNISSKLSHLSRDINM